MKGLKKGTSQHLFVLASTKLYESEDQCSNPLSYGRLRSELYPMQAIMSNVPNPLSDTVEITV